MAYVGNNDAIPSRYIGVAVAGVAAPIPIRCVVGFVIVGRDSLLLVGVAYSLHSSGRLDGEVVLGKRRSSYRRHLDI